jgi:hypothetical protein
MYPKKRVTSKAPNTKASTSGRQAKDEPKVVGYMHDETSRILEKEG